MYWLKTDDKDGNIKKMIKKMKNITKFTAVAISMLFVNPSRVFADCAGGDAKDCLKSPEASPIMNTITTVINGLAASVIIFATIMFVVAGIQYTTSNGDPQKVSDAKKKITDIIIGLAAFFFLYGIMQWLIPGGIF